MFVQLSRNGVYIMISNSDTEFIRLLYRSAYFTVDTVMAKRAINCNGARRGKVPELVITDYPRTGNPILRW